MSDILTPLGVAVALVERHKLSIVPLPTGQKHPKIAYKEFQTRRPTVDELIEWFADPEHTGIGLMCGEISNVVGVDDDLDEQDGSVPNLSMYRTWTLRSGSGNRIELFRWEPGLPTTIPVGKGMKVRCDRHIVVLPPSVHPDGGTYEWLPGLSPDDVPLLPLPDELKVSAVNTTESRAPEPLLIQAEPNSRHDELIKIIGVHVRRGDPREVILSLARAYNREHCKPPREDEHIVKTVNDLLHRYPAVPDPEDDSLGVLVGGNGEDAPPEIPDEIDIAPTIKLDDCIPASGYLTDLVAEATRSSMVPREFVLATGLAQMAALLQGKVNFWLGTTFWGTAVWPILLGAAGSKKSSALSYMNLLRQIGFGGEVEDITKEALSNLLAARRDAWAVHSEFSQLIQDAERSYMKGIKPFLGNLWDGHLPYKTRQRVDGGLVEMHYPTLTMVGATTLSDLQQWAATEDIRRGFLTRCLFVPQEETPDFVGLGSTSPRAAMDALSKELEQRMRLVKAQPIIDLPSGAPNEAQFAGYAKTILYDYDQAWSQRDPLSTAVEGFQQRVPATAIRLSIGYALSRAPRPLIVSAEDARHGIAFTEWCRERSWPLIDKFFSTDTWQARQIAKVNIGYEDLARKTEDGRVTQRSLQRKIKMYGRPWEDAIGYLVDVENWEVGESQAAGGRGGRPVTWYRRKNKEVSR